MLEWNVCAESGKIVNAFADNKFLYDCHVNYKDNFCNREMFLDQLRKDLMQRPEMYRQIAINWDRFGEYVWVHRGAFKKMRSKKNGQN
jgi:hypothetical protein